MKPKRYVRRPFIICTILPVAIIEVEPHGELCLEEIAAEKLLYKIFEFLRPVAVDQSNKLLRGHARLEAAKQLGLTTIPALKVPPEYEHDYRPGVCECGGTI